MNRTGKCVNYASCLLAYRGEAITIAEGNFVCPECGQPLHPASAPKGFNFKTAVLSAAVIIFIALAGILIGGSILSRYQNAYSAGEQLGPHPSEAPRTPAASAASAAPTVVESAPPVAPTSENAEATVAPSEVHAEANPDLNLATDETQKTKSEVLKRIDLMPTISEDNKDKLYMSVDRARQMGRLLVVPFASGRTEMAASDITKLRTELQSPGVKKLLDDPTAVFVILGFADTAGDPKANLKISETRARDVMDVLHDQCGVINVMHCVGMGGSQLFDASGREKNRVVEIWTVLP